MCIYILPGWCACVAIHTYTIHIRHTHTQLPSSRLDSYTFVLSLHRTHIRTTFQIGHTCTYHLPGRANTCTYYHMIITLEGGIHTYVCVLCGGCVCYMWRLCLAVMWRLSIRLCMHPTWMVCVFYMEGAHGIYVCTRVPCGGWCVYIHVHATLQVGHTCTYHPSGRAYTRTYYHMIITVEGMCVLHVKAGVLQSCRG